MAAAQKLVDEDGIKFMIVSGPPPFSIGVGVVAEPAEVLRVVTYNCYTPEELSEKTPFAFVCPHNSLLGMPGALSYLKQAVTALEAIYETDFKGFSYGFRPRRGAHDALDALAVGISWKKVNCMLDADIRGFFEPQKEKCIVYIKAALLDHFKGDNIVYHDIAGHFFRNIPHAFKVRVMGAMADRVFL